MQGEYWEAERRFDHDKVAPYTEACTPAQAGEDLQAHKGAASPVWALSANPAFNITRAHQTHQIMKNVDLDDINPALFSLVTLVFKTVFVAHLVSCFWFFITSST